MTTRRPPTDLPAGLTATQVWGVADRMYRHDAVGALVIRPAVQIAGDLRLTVAQVHAALAWLRGQHPAQR